MRFRVSSYVAQIRYRFDIVPMLDPPLILHPSPVVWRRFDVNLQLLYKSPLSPPPPSAAINQQQEIEHFLFSPLRFSICCVAIRFEYSRPVVAAAADIRWERRERELIEREDDDRVYFSTVSQCALCVLAVGTAVWVFVDTLAPLLFDTSLLFFLLWAAPDVRSNKMRKYLKARLLLLYFFLSWWWWWCNKCVCDWINMKLVFRVRAGGEKRRIRLLTEREISIVVVVFSFLLILRSWSATAAARKISHHHTHNQVKGIKRKEEEKEEEKQKVESTGFSPLFRCCSDSDEENLFSSCHVHLLSSRTWRNMPFAAATTLRVWCCFLKKYFAIS